VPVNAKYGNEPGQKIYTHVSDQYAPFHSQLITATAGEAPYVRLPRHRTFDNQALKASGLNLVSAAIVYWNTLYIGQAVDHLRGAGSLASDELQTHFAPLGWRHISLTGDYLCQEVSSGIGVKGFGALNIPDVSKIWAA
jgi:TnpA family transposase